MAFNGSGVFLRLYTWVNDAASDIKIRADRMDNEMNGFATGLSTCITKNGQTTITANLPMAGYRHTGVGNALNRTDYAAAGQVQDGKINWADAGGTADAITASYTPTVSALVDGQLFFVRAAAANTSTTPTFNPDSTGDKTITKNGAQALVAGDIGADGHELILRYRLSDTSFELLNPIGLDSSLVTLTGTQTLTNKTLTSPVINTGVSGTAILDDDTFATASSTTVPTSESVKAYVDGQALSVTDWTAYAPSTQGFGTISSSNVLYRIIGNHMEIIGSFTTGTVTGDEAQVSLPSGYQVNGTLITSICIAGMCVRSSTGGSPINTLITGSDTFINFGKQDASLAGLTPLAANSIVGNTVSISFHATIPFTTT